jgi:hypothetical protein
MPKQDSLARTAIIFIKTGKTSWRKVPWRKEKRASAVPPAIARIPDAVWNRLFTTSVSGAIESTRGKVRRQVPVFAGDVI